MSKCFWCNGNVMPTSGYFQSIGPLVQGVPSDVLVFCNLEHFFTYLQWARDTRQMQSISKAFDDHAKKTIGKLDSEGEPMHQFASGAKRSELKPRFDLIPTTSLRRLAMRYALGAKKYGDWNYQKGLPVSDTINHIIDHLIVYRDKVRNVIQGHDDKEEQLRDLKSLAGVPDDDLAGAAWGCMTLMYLEEVGKLLLE